MSEKFTASNGMQVAWRPDDRGVEVLQSNAEYAKYCLPEPGWRVVGAATSASGNPGFTDGSESAVALREFFRHERDEELGRWRWPENPDYVVYPDYDGHVSTLHEITGIERGSYSRDGVTGANDNATSVLAARAYFAAHPISKPWHDAKPGEVWLLTLAGGDEQPSVVFDFDGVAHFSIPGIEDFSINYGRITAGRRIFPEATDA